MAKRVQPAPPEAREFTTFGEIDAAIGKVRRRINEVEGLDPAAIRFNDPRVKTAEGNIRSMIQDVFGAASLEYDEHRYHTLDMGSHHVAEDPSYTQQCFIDGRVQTLGMLQGLLERLHEKRGEMDEPLRQPIAEFRHRTLHPVIVTAAEGLFNGGHHAQAVFEASKVLVDAVKRKSARQDLDGTDLMRKVFSRRNSALAFNQLADQSDEDEQEGLMHLFEGAVLAIRNPRGHRPGMADDPALALEYLSLLSLLMGRLDASVVRPEGARPFP
jgi:uncharacterized protein (TIGR02391 family)